jgi:hypothetical protein
VTAPQGRIWPQRSDDAAMVGQAPQVTLASFLFRPYTRKATRSDTRRSDSSPLRSGMRRLGEAARRWPPQPSRVGQMCSPVGLRIADAVCPNEGPLFVYRIVGKPGERAPAGERVLTRRVVWLVRGIGAPTWTSGRWELAFRRRGNAPSDADYTRKARPRTESKASSGPLGSGRLSRNGRERLGAPDSFSVLLAGGTGPAGSEGRAVTSTTGI